MTTTKRKPGPRLPSPSQVGELNRECWAMLPEQLEILIRCEIPEAARIEDEDIAWRDKVAVLPLTGVLAQRGWWLETALNAWTTRFQALIDSDAVSTIVLEIDSPGGTVFGVPETAEIVRRSRARKPVLAAANSLAASAAYWIGSAATELYVTPGGQVGSIGVWSAHVDMSQALEDAGLKVTLVEAGQYKTEGNPWEPLGDEARDEMQAEVDYYYGLFVRAVAKQRGVQVGQVESDFGQGRLVRAKDAAAAGMVDGVATLEEVLQKASQLAGGRKEAARRARQVRDRELDLRLTFQCAPRE